METLASADLRRDRLNHSVFKPALEHQSRDLQPTANDLRRARINGSDESVRPRPGSGDRNKYGRDSTTEDRMDTTASWADERVNRYDGTPGRGFAKPNRASTH